MRRRVRLRGPVDLRRTLFRGALFPVDPTMVRERERVWVATRAHGDAATLSFEASAPDEVEVCGFGPAAEAALESAALRLGADDAPESFVTSHPMLAPLVRRHAGLRFGRRPGVVERLVPTILAQKVTGAGASRSWRQLLRATSERAPGPCAALWLPPCPSRLAELAYYDLHPFGVERRRAETLLRVVRSARKLEVTSRAAPPQRERRLLAMRGLGPWTVSSIESVVMGDPDRVILGDYHIPNLVSYALGGEDRGDDAAMLALLEPFRPHRGRVIALLQASRMSPPRFGPRLSVRDIRSG